VAPVLGEEDLLVAAGKGGGVHGADHTARTWPNLQSRD
jgi:hypothetical protein